MSFLSDVFEIGKKAVKFFSGDSIGANVAKTVASGFLLNRVTKSINKDTARPSAAATSEIRGTVIDEGVRLQVEPDPNQSIPVVYGRASLFGAITHVEIQNRSTLYAVFVISERTGVRLSDGVQSQFTFRNIRINDQRVIFKTGGQIVDFTLDRSGAVDRSLDGLVEIRCFDNGSNSAVRPQGHNSGGNMEAAHQFIPTWSSSDSMNQLVFAVVQITYNRERGTTSIPNINFEVENSMTLPGDCINDYMTNTRYGAGIPPQEIYSE